MSRLILFITASLLVALYWFSPSLDDLAEAIDAQFSTFDKEIEYSNEESNNFNSAGFLNQQPIQEWRHRNKGHGKHGKPTNPDEDSTLAILDRWNRFIPEEDKVEKYCAMASGFFRFFRGSNHLYWERFAHDPKLLKFGGGKNFRTWLQGDLHPENFGSFHDAESQLVYNVNDFDDAVPDDYQLDLWRMSIGMILMAQTNGVKDLDKIKKTTVTPFLKSYLERIKELHDLKGVIPKGSDLNLKTAKPPLQAFLAKVATDYTREKLLNKITKLDEHGLRVFDVDNPKIEAPDEEAKRLLETGYYAYYPQTLDGIKWDPSYFKIKDIARKRHAGTGSLGLDRMLILIEGPTNSTDDDRILDTKTQTIPCAVLFQYWDRRQEYEELNGDNHAAAFCKSARAMTNHRFRFLGWLRTLNGGTYSINEVSPYKATFDITSLKKDDEYESMAHQWGYIMANAHVRSNGKGRSSEHLEASIVERIKSVQHGEQAFIDLAWDQAVKFAKQTVKDTAELAKAVKDRKYECPPPV